MSTDTVTPLRRIPEWTFAERVRKARRDTGLKQAALADQLGVTLSTYQAWETGRNKPGDIIGVAEQLEERTGIAREWFLGWAPRGSNPEPADWVHPARQRHLALVA